MASRQDLDNWKELGNDGWSFDDLQPYYRKCETYNPPSEALASKINNKYIDPRLRGTNGPIQVSVCTVLRSVQTNELPLDIFLRGRYSVEPGNMARSMH